MSLRSVQNSLKANIYKTALKPISTNLGPECFAGVKFRQQCAPRRWKSSPVVVCCAHKCGFCAAQRSINGIYRLRVDWQEKLPKLATACVEDLSFEVIPLVLQYGHLDGAWHVHVRRFNVIRFPERMCSWCTTGKLSQIYHFCGSDGSCSRRDDTCLRRSASATADVVTPGHVRGWFPHISHVVLRAHTIKSQIIMCIAQCSKQNRKAYCANNAHNTMRIALCAQAPFKTKSQIIMCKR